MQKSSKNSRNLLRNSKNLPNSPKNPKNSRNSIDTLRNSPESFSQQKNSIFPSLNSFSDIISKKAENSIEFRCFEPFSERNLEFSRRKWGPKFIKMKKIPIPAYKLFKKQKFDYNVMPSLMPSLKRKYLANLSLKELGNTEKTEKNEDFIDKNQEKYEKTEEFFKEKSEKIEEFLLRNQEKSENFIRENNEKIEDFYIKNEKNTKISKEKEDKSFGIREKSMRHREKSLEKNKLDGNNSPRLKTGGNGLNLFTNFKARMSQKYKK